MGSGFKKGRYGNYFEQSENNYVPECHISLSYGANGNYEKVCLIE